MWVSLALTLLKLVNSIVVWAHDRELISQGYDKAIAEVSYAIFLKTAAGKAVRDKVAAMSDAEVDAALRKLEPADPVK